MQGTRKTIKQEIKKIKKICVIAKGIDAIHKWLDYFYKRVSNKEITKEDAEKYDLQKIVLYGKEKKRFAYIVNDGNGIIFEFYKYPFAPQSFLLIYNKFIANRQTEVDFYILKGETNDKEDND